MLLDTHVGRGAENADGVGVTLSIAPCCLQNILLDLDCIAGGKTYPHRRVVGGKLNLANDDTIAVTRSSGLQNLDTVDLCYEQYTVVVKMKPFVVNSCTFDRGIRRTFTPCTVRWNVKCDVAREGWT